jgi:hypothetical protein
VRQVFVLLAGGTSFDVFSDPCPGAKPEVFLVHASDCFISSWVAVKGAIMPSVHDFAFQALVGGNNEAMRGDVSPKWCTWTIYSFDGKCVLPLFHEGAVVVLNDRDEVFYGATGVFICDADKEWFGKHDHLLVVVFAHIGAWRS